MFIGTLLRQSVVEFWWTQSGFGDIRVRGCSVQWETWIVSVAIRLLTWINCGVHKPSQL